MIAVRLAVAVFAFNILVGCAGGQTKTHYYALQVGEGVGLERSIPEGRSIGIGPIRLPSELDRQGLVSYTNSGELDVAAFHIWAGELDENLTAVLADAIGRYLGSSDVHGAPWDTRNRPEVQVRLDVYQLGGVLGGAVTMDALITLSTDNGRRKLLTQRIRSEHATSDDGHSAYVAALNAAVQAVARDVSTLLADSLSN